MFFGFYWLTEVMIILCLVTLLYGRPLVSRFVLACVILCWFGLGVAEDSPITPVVGETLSALRWAFAMLTVVIIMPRLMDVES